jgi:hypothetical protein
MIAGTQNRLTQNMKTQHRPQPGLNRDTAAQMSALATSDVERLVRKGAAWTASEKKDAAAPSSKGAPR